jgi:hypothetical protein
MASALSMQSVLLALQVGVHASHQPNSTVAAHSRIAWILTVTGADGRRNGFTEPS